MAKKYLNHPEYSQKILEWDYSKNTILPENVTHGSNKKFWWLCLSKKHSYQASVINKVLNNSGCPYCAGKLPIRGETDLSTTHPNLVLEMVNPEDGYNYSKGSNKSVDWICANNHTWSAKVRDRALGKGCPYCSGRSVLVGYNDLMTINENLAKQLRDTSLAYKLTSMSNKRVEWVCNRNSSHVWEAAVYQRSSGTGCPKCFRRISKPEIKLTEMFSGENPVPQFKIRDHRITTDIFIPSRGLIIEYDGAKFHYDRVEEDLIKTEIILKMGYKVVRMRETGNHTYQMNRLPIENPNLLQIMVEYSPSMEHVISAVSEIKRWSD